MSKAPSTAATRLLKARNIAFTEHLYRYEEHGGTSPFGTRKVMKVFVEATILGLERIYINGGSRGFLVGMNPQDLMPLLALETVTVGITE